METAAVAILKIVADYGALGLGWIAWILTLWYYKTERERYQALVFSIIEYFTKVNLAKEINDAAAPDFQQALGDSHNESLGKLLGGVYGGGRNGPLPVAKRPRNSGRSRRGPTRPRLGDEEDEEGGDRI